MGGGGEGEETGATLDAGVLVWMTASQGCLMKGFLGYGMGFCALKSGES